MKKVLLFGSFLVSGVFFGQVLINDNFTSFTVGNIGTTVAGTVAGQGGYFTGNSAGGTNNGNANYQIVATGNTTYGNAFQLTGSDAATGNKFMWKNGFGALWNGRTSTNNIIEIEFDFFTGPPSVSRNDFRLVIYSAEATPRILAGIFFTKNATISAINYTNVVQGLALADNAGTPTLYSYGLGASAATPHIVFSDNTWVKVGFSINFANGLVTWKGPGFNGTDVGSALGLAPGEIDFVSGAGATNTVAAAGIFDNFVVRASATNTLLSINEIVASKFSISPNPTSDFVNISSTDNIGVNAVSVADINGRVVKEISYQNVADIQVNLSDLAAGMYIMSIKSEQGTATKKILKN